jgi:hypothetical protein
MAGDTKTVPHQAGVLEGSNPSAYNSSDPIVLFIIQVRSHIPLLSRESVLISYGVFAVSHHHCSMSSAPLAVVEASTAPSHRRGHRRNRPRYGAF